MKVTALSLLRIVRVEEVAREMDRLYRLLEQALRLMKPVDFIFQ
jgi:hypothetical protein